MPTANIAPGAGITGAVNHYYGKKIDSLITGLILAGMPPLEAVKYQMIVTFMAKRIKLTEKAEPLISEMEAVINKTRAEILHGISAEELEQLITLIAKLEHNIIELQAKG